MNAEKVAINDEIATNDEVMALLSGCYESTEEFNNGLGLLVSVKYFINYNKMMERKASNEFEKNFFRMMNDSILASDHLSSLIKRLNYNEINEKFGESVLGPLIRRLKESDDEPIIPSDLDERIEKYLNEKQKID